jgi:hypothetical protein
LNSTGDHAKANKALNEETLSAFLFGKNPEKILKNKKNQENQKIIGQGGRNQNLLVNRA